jgi:hypothetical protein
LDGAFNKLCESSDQTIEMQNFNVAEPEKSDTSKLHRLIHQHFIPFTTGVSGLE